MNNQMIPADKVRELIEHFVNKRVEVDNLEVINLLRNLEKELLPSQQPTTGLLGRWAKHPEHGDVVCVWDEPMEGHITVHYRYKDERTGTLYDQVPLDYLTFPHQATKPEDVPAGEAWRVRHVDGTEFNAIKTGGPFPWRFFSGEFESHDGCRDVSVTLVCPLVPERPVSDLQSKYDALDAKYEEAQERIKTLEQNSTPRTVRTPEEYDALPVKSIVAGRREVEPYPFIYSGSSRTVLRFGWGNEQPKPAWRIETDHTNLSEGEYIIDRRGDDGVVTGEHGVLDWIATDGEALGAQGMSPFIVFPNRDAATPEAVAEAKKARDKELEK